MAYISKEQVAEIRKQIAPVLKEMGLKATLRREHYSKVVLSVKSKGKLINEFYNSIFTTWGMPDFANFTEQQKRDYAKFKERRKEISAQIEILEKSLLLPEYRDNSDPMTDYFDVSYFTYVNILD